MWTNKYEPIILSIFMLALFSCARETILLGKSPHESRKKHSVLVSEIFSIIQKHYIDPVDASRLVAGSVKEMEAVLTAEKNTVKSPHLDFKSIDNNEMKAIIALNDAIGAFAASSGKEIKDIEYAAIIGMLKSLDARSSFMTAQKYKELGNDLRRGGVGLEMTIKKDVLTVVSAIDDTPAFVAGIKAGDQIMMINGQSTKGMTLEDVIQKLRGELGTEVTLTMKVGNMATLREIILTRGVIKIKSVKSKTIDKDIGYIRLSAFQEKTAENLKKEVGDLVSVTTPLKGLILDLRDNSGGLVTAAIDVADIFLKSGAIFSTKGRTKNMNRSAMSKDSGDEPNCPIIVLVNERTYGAAEIVAGALQDNGRALILGTQTLGGGTVQTIIPLDDDSALKLTTARWYSPSGREISKGISPHVRVEYTEANDTQLHIAWSAIRKLQGPLLNIDTLKTAALTALREAENSGDIHDK